MYDAVRSLDVSRLRYIIICYGTLNVKFIFSLFLIHWKMCVHSNDYCGVGIYNGGEKKRTITARTIKKLD